MANVKISELPLATSVPPDSLLPVVISGVTKRAVVSKVNPILSVKQYGAVGDNSTDDTTAIQAAITAASSGDIVYFPPGTYKVTAAITIPNGMRLMGGGRTKSIIAGYSTTANIFTVSTNEAVRFEQLEITRTSTVATAGAGIQFTDPSTENIGSTVDDCVISNCFRGIHFLKAQQWKVTNCYIADYYQIGVYVQNTYDGDSGDSYMSGNMIITSRGGTTYGVFQGSGGGLRAIGNKFLSGSYGIFFDLETGITTGILLIEGNSIEGQSVAGIDIENAASNGGFTHVVVTGNQVAGQPTCIVTSGGSDFLFMVNISHNSLACANAGTCVSLSRGIRVYVGENVMVGSAGGTTTGLLVGGNVSNFNFGTDIFSGITTKYSISGTSYTHTEPHGQGANVTAANNLTLGVDGDYYEIDGATQINLLSATGWFGGDRVILKFNSNPTVKTGQATSGANKSIKLNGAVDFSATAGDTLSLVYDATDAIWYEQARAVI